MERLVEKGDSSRVNLSLRSVTVTTFKIIANGNKGTINISLEKGAVLPAGTTDDLGKHVTVAVTEKPAE